MERSRVRRARSERVPESGRHDERQPGAPARQLRVHRARRVSSATMSKYGEAANRSISRRLVGDRSPSTTTIGTLRDVGGRRIAQQRQLDHRRDDDDPEQLRRAAQLEELLPDQRADAATHRRVSLTAARPSTNDRVDHKRASGAHEVRQVEPFQHDAAQRDQEVARGHDRRDVLQADRHAGDRKDEPGQDQRRQHRDERRRLKRDLLRVGDGRHEQPRAERADQKHGHHERQRRASCRASAGRRTPWRQR